MAKMRIRFQVTLIVVLVGMIATTALGLMLVQTNGARSIEQDSALAFMDEVGDRASGQVTALLDPVAAILRVMATRPALAASTEPGDAEIVPALIASLTAMRGVYGLLLGYEDGNYLHLESMAAIPAALRADEQAPPNAAYRLTVIRHEGPERIQRQTWLDGGGLPLDTTVTTHNPTFDPRIRPWYRDRPDDVPAHMSDLYVFFTLKVPGYTISVPFRGKVYGVLAADILLTSLDEFLKALRISPNARVVLVDGQGAVASAGGLADLMREQAKRLQRDELVPPSLGILRYPAIEAALAKWDGRSQAHENVTVGGRDYIASISPVASSLARGLHVVAIAPLDEFFNAIDRLRYRSLLYALALTLAAIPIAVEIGRRISRQLAAVADEARSIRRFELAIRPPIQSRLIEIDDLADAVARAKSTVRDFARYVPRGLVKQLIESGATLELGGERREMTVLFTDAVDFTALSEKADATDLMRNASRYLAALSMAIAERGGTIDKYIGDSIMAFWNAPVADDDHVAHGCEAILACREANRALNERFAAESWPAMHTRYGLHVGEVVVGNIGSEDRMNYTAIGAAVNLASRLQQLNTLYGTDSLLSETVVARVRDRFLFRRIGRVLPKGISEPLTVYSLVGTRSGIAAGVSDRLDLWEHIVAECDRGNWARALSDIEAFLKLDPADRVARSWRDRCLRSLEDRPI